MRAPIAPQLTVSARYCGCDRIEELAAHRDPEGDDVEQERSGREQPVVDPEAPVQPRVVDEALPSDRRARLLEVGPHDDDQIVLVAIGQSGQPVGVLEPGLGVVDRAGSDDDEQTVVPAVEDRRDGLPATDDHLGELVAQRQLAGQLPRRDEGPDVGDPSGCGPGPSVPRFLTSFLASRSIRG